MQVTVVHLLFLTVTLASIVVVGGMAARKVKTAADYSVGGHSSGIWMVMGTIIGTIIGGASTIGTAQLAFQVGIAGIWFTLGTGMALFIMGFLYAKPLRASNLETIPQFLVKNYGRTAGPLTSIASSLGIFFSIVANILAATPLITAIFQVGLVQAAVIVLVLILGYVFFGGVWATGRVGIIKCGLIYLTLLTVAGTAYSMMGGMTGFSNALPQDPWFNIFGRGVWVDIAAGISLLVGTLTTQTYVQAVYSAKDQQAAQKGTLLAAFLTFFSGIPAVMAGMFMRIHHPDIEAISALPLYIVYYLPPWLGGIGLAALLLAAVGSAAGLALGVGTMLSREILSVSFKQATDKVKLAVNRSTVLFITVLAALMTLGNLKSLVLEWNYLSMGLRGAGVILPLSLAVFFPGKLKAKYALFSMAGGAFTTFIWKFILAGTCDPLYPGLLVSLMFIMAGLKK